jgi:Cdc6-like AAA superfamily ATPase
MHQGDKKRLILQRDWDIPIHPYGSKYDSKDTEEGYFAGREKELVFLTNELIRKKNGSILVCGHRGVGKTSLVYKAIRKLKEQCHNAIVVVVNYSQLEIKNQDEIEQKKVLESLIKRLYYSVERTGIKLEPEIKNEIKELYDKAIASEYNLCEYNNQRHDVSEIKEKKFSLYFDKVNLIYFIFWILAIIFGIIGFTSLTMDLTRVITFLLVFPIPFTINLFYKINSLHTEKDYLDSRMEEVHKFDNSIGNLEYDLECLYRKMADNGIKVVYVIDELDKQKPQVVNKILENFKNLFTLSEAQFIFITGQETYDEIYEKSKKDYRPKEYTYFTSKYFLSRPLLSDLLDYFEKITYNSTQIKEKDLIFLKKALIFEAHSDFFDLKACIKNRITSFDMENRPIIELDEPLDGDIQKGRFQTMISSLFEEKYMFRNPLKWSENEKLQREIYKHADKIYNSHQLTEFEDPEDDSLKSELIKEFNSLLVRYGAFSTLQPRSKDMRGSTKIIAKYKYEGSIPTEPPSSLSSFTEYETKFMRIFKRYCSYVISIINAFEVMRDLEELDEKLFFTDPSIIPKKIRNFGISEFNDFSNYLKLYNSGIEKNSLERYNREELEKMTENVRIAIKALFTKIPNALVNEIRNEYKEQNLNNSMQSSKFLKDLYQKLNEDPIYDSIIQQLFKFSSIAFPCDKEIFIGIDEKNVLKNFISPENNGNYENEILIIEIDISDESWRGNLKIIEIDSPRNLKETIINFLQIVKVYMSNLNYNEN